MNDEGTRPDLDETGTMEKVSYLRPREGARPSRIHLALDRDVVVLVLEASEQAAEDAVEVLRIARDALRTATGAVERAQMDADTAASRAAFVRSRLERAMVNGVEIVTQFVDEA